MGCSPWGGEESDTTERLHFHFHFQWLGLSALSAMAQIQSLGQENPLEKEMTTHSSIPAWEIPWTEEHDRP